MTRRRDGYVVTGCSRSGTTYTCVLLNRLGRDLGHEAAGAEGTVSWYLAVEAAEGRLPGHAVSWAQLRQTFDRVRILHLVRHPLECIGSCQTLSRMSWRLIERFVPAARGAAPVARCMAYWRHWNRLAEARAEWTLCVEQVPQRFEALCRFFGVAPDRGILEKVPTDLNTRRHRYRPLAWSDLEAADGGLCAAVRHQARRYGYPV